MRVHRIILCSIAGAVAAAFSGAALLGIFTYFTYEGGSFPMSHPALAAAVIGFVYGIIPAAASTQTFGCFLLAAV
jgi:hypothetical protein